MAKIELLEPAVGMTRAAGDVIMSFYQGAFDVADKAPDNPVTDADFAADALLKERLLELLPEAGWLSEETVDQPDRLNKDYVWVVDPLDGTKEFVMGIPEFSVSVALVECGQPVFGIIYNPVTQEMFAGARDLGITLNRKRVTVSSRMSLAGSRVDASRSERKRGEFEPFEADLEITTVGSIAYKLARTAAGLSDMTWSRGPKHEWDICAGVLLVQAAGGVCVDLDDREFSFNQPYPKVNGVVADNGRCHAALMNTLAPHRAEARVD